MSAARAGLRTLAGYAFMMFAVTSASRCRSFQLCAVNAERDVDVATRGVRVRAKCVRSAHEILGVDT